MRLSTSVLCLALLAVVFLNSASSFGGDETNYFNRGNARARKGDLNGAQIDYNKAIQLNPKYCEAYRNRGFAKSDMGNLDRAMLDYNKAIELNSEYALAYLSRGLLSYNMREYADALADFRKYCELDAEHSQDFIRFRIWLIRARSGEMALATAELKTYLQNRKAKKPADWPINVANYLTGDLSEPDLFKSAENPDKRKDAGQHCEAYFFAGTKRLIKGDISTATNFFWKCLATNMKHYQDYRSAVAELKYFETTNQVSTTNIDRPKTVKQARASSTSDLEAYDQQFTSAINAKWQSLIDAESLTSPNAGRIVAKFRLHQDGSVSDITFADNTDKHATWICEQAIMECSPFPKWSDKMRSNVGQDYRNITFTFYIGPRQVLTP
jgi:lipoprotein NlpI